MDLNQYQTAARQTDQKVQEGGLEAIIPILGLASEAGELLNEYKKFLRDGPAHTRFPDRLAEELGDILWYVAVTATRFGFDLETVAARNLEKTQSRWGQDGDSREQGPSIVQLDAAFPEHERFQRRFIAEFRQSGDGANLKTRVFVDGKQMGQDLTDNAYTPDGYRFHDVFHLACVAVLGWSPVSRRNLGLKRRSRPDVDEVEDGGRAIVTEEGISALVFAYAREHNALEGVRSVDYDLLKAIRIMAAKFEVSVRTTGDWERAILMGYQTWKEVERNQGGFVELDLDGRTIRYLRKI